ncbi:BRCT domain superfamily [Arabidopsis suecica]|uniref:BRCT domain superfamily n=1 Tax=Arabidopsis suecica TaxID=45249 RepID=A0A8T2FKZ0_ARASU|nr:BRCT domain superfamily [Arabidopsis suecica]
MAKSNQNFSPYEETQPIDSNPPSSSDSGEDKDSLLGDCDTQPVDDNALINDQYMETQVMDTECDNEEFFLCNETQAVDLGFETGEEVLVEGKQLLEASDGLATQVLDLCDDEVVVDSDDDVTDVLEGNSDLSDSDDSGSKAETVLSSEENRQDANEKVKSAVVFDAWSNEHGVSGKKVARFASVRSAAFRASAVAARVANQKSANTDCSTLINCHSSGKGTTHNSGLENSVGEVGNQQSLTSLFVEEKKDLRTGKKTARKLFVEDFPEEKFHSTDCNVDLGNLSYIGSQEPGEESQASALNLVDKLISECRLEFDFEVQADYGRKTEDKSKFVQIFKGPQELAKKVSYKSGAVGNNVFDWDDNREDEGGGDIYRRRKDEFFGVASKRREFSSLPREQKRELIPVAVDKRWARSDSKLLKHSVTRSRKNIQGAKKNLGKELDEVREAAVLGNDTQVAAEAIDDLCSGDRGKFDGEASCLTGKKLSPEEERGFSPGGVVTRQSKGTKRIQAMSKDELLKKRMKKASPSPAKACRTNIEGSSNGDQLNKEGPCCWKSRKVQTASRETKKNLVDEFDEVSQESNTEMFDRHEEAEAGPDTQMAAEVMNALHSGDGREIDPEPNNLIGKKLLLEGGISRCGVVTRKSKRIKGIQAVDNDVESLKPKNKKARSILAKSFEKNMDRYSKNDKVDTPDEAVASTTEKRQGELSNKHCMSKLLKQSHRGEAEVLNYPKRRRSARISQDQVNEAGRSSDPAFDTPAKSKTPSTNVSPICMGDEYHRLSCKDSFTSHTTREFRSLTVPVAEPISETKSTRKRRDLGSICVLFSQHLDEDVTKHQKKILARFDISEASSMKEATHFIADNFTRTRNMLEAIASGKPVVTTQWLESIDQVNIYVDEDMYILRDSKKEKEFCFNMGVSLARARQFPLLQGRRVFITPNTKPALNTITTLVKAVHGLPVERLGRSSLSEDKVPENLLVLSCEEDRAICIPFLERGAEVYSSELLLNGIVTQRLEYERYRLFTDHVRRTRSTIWIKDGKGKFQRRSG